MCALPLPLLICLAMQASSPTARLAPLLGIPYAPDGAEDEAGHFVRFAAPGECLPRPGLNCSGFAVAAARRLLGFRGSLTAAARDRQGDSGEGAALGQDWDFGLDLVLNLSEGLPRRQLGPEGAGPISAAGRGFSLAPPAIWETLASRLRPRAVYLASFSWVKGGRTFHHHVAVFLKDAQGRSWLYHTLPGGRVHRLSLDLPEGRDRLRKVFGAGQRLFLLEVDPPSAVEGAPIQR